MDFSSLSGDRLAIFRPMIVASLEAVHSEWLASSALQASFPTVGEYVGHRIEAAWDAFQMLRAYFGDNLEGHRRYIATAEAIAASLTGLDRGWPC